jgi:hypothetical protein
MDARWNQHFFLFKNNTITLSKHCVNVMSFSISGFLKELNVGLIGDKVQLIVLILNFFKQSSNLSPT